MSDQDKGWKALMGIILLVVGMGGGYLMWTHPEGLNPEWPLLAALLAPAVFVFGGLHLVAGALGYPRLAGATLGWIVVAFWGVANWAAFFTTHASCAVTVSFLGNALVRQNLSQEECRSSLQTIIGAIDVLVVIGAAGLAWRRTRTPRD
jgi:hypothetical protein